MKTYEEMIGELHKEPLSDLEIFINEKLERILKAYGLGRITVFFKKNNNFLTETKYDLFATKYDPVYKGFNVIYTDVAIDKWNKKEYNLLVDGLVHEVAHLVLHRLATLAEHRHTTKKEIHDSVEETTETIAQLARALLVQIEPEIFQE